MKRRRTGRFTRRVRRRTATPKTKVDKKQSRDIKRLQNNKEKKFDLGYSSVLGTPGVPDIISLTNNIGVQSVPPLANDLNLQIRNVTPYIEQGLTDYRRIGDEVSLKTFGMNMVFSYVPTADDKIKLGDVAHCRVILCWDNEPVYQGPPSGTQNAPTISENPLSWNHILSAGGKENSVVPLFSCDYYNNDLVYRSKRISVIKDLKFDLVAGTARGVKRVAIFKKWKNQLLKYLSSNNTVINRQLKLAFVSNKTASECPTVFWSQRSVYTDS